ncbi:ESX secretion-associated protein EspG [Nocardia sp. NBC_00565]|uniref:ESX secretion-associated protein EspG n=1 Tax=Nocardia sp. NBC_00565 TaxID=2975993 RepID=UPI002E804FC0|nr:ESX secretion-associated protein EspG [Nocardia sp. NBC_00565]WUC07664.1 ESX secretion-associated protein EspG [Nocardia sp. NBC_00565]
METDPIAIDLNVDAALLLQDMAGIDSYPPVLALLPNVYKLDDLERVRAVVAQELTEVGIIDGDRVHPVVEDWLQCLYRPDMELVARVLDTGLDGETQGMLRMSLVRHGETHVLAVRHDDEVVIQPVFQQGRQLDTICAAVTAALGACPALSFEPMTASQAELGEVPADQDECRRALLELGAQPHTAGVLSRVLDEVVRRAEIVVIEHQDGNEQRPKFCVSVLDTLSGRVIVTPSVAMDGEVRSTYAPGDDAALYAAIGALVELLPGRSWFDTSRVG